MSDDLTPDTFRPEYISGPPEHWQIEDMSGASWAVRKLAAIRKQEAEVMAVWESERDEIDRWARERTQALALDAATFVGMLEHWHRQLLAEDPKLKTIKLPQGKLTARQQPAAYEVDPDAFLPWARENRPEWVRVKEVPALAEIKAATEAAADPETGETIPGLTINPGEVKFTVTTESTDQ